MAKNNRGSSSSEPIQPRLLAKGEVVSLQNGKKVTVKNDKPLGRGGQGVVYKVIDDDSQSFALKWITNTEYFRTDNPVFYNNLLALAKQKEKEKKRLKNFALPLALTKVEDSGQFGYLMDLIPSKMTPLYKILSQDRGFGLFGIQLTSCINLIKNISYLHLCGLIFSDINEGSFFFDLDNGDVMICDCDNIVQASNPGKPLGTIGYMAPEIFDKKLDESKRRCSKRSDVYSLAIILFRILMRDDPFNGKKWLGIIEDEDSKYEMYVDNPTFTLDPDNDSNRPSSDFVINNWNKLPEDVRLHFTKMFTEGVKDPSVRDEIYIWKSVFESWFDLVQDDPLGLALDMPKVPKKAQIILFVVDVSCSMSGKKINEVNKSIKDCIKSLKKIEDNNSSINYEIGILKFGDGCSWYGDSIVAPVNDFKFTNIKPTDVDTDFDTACRVLDLSFINKVFIDEKKKYKRPFLLLISDGKCPKTYYQPFLTELHTNRIFRKSQKYAIGADDETDQADIEMLSAFTGDVDNVESVDVIKEKLGDLIHNLTISFSISRMSNPQDLKLKNVVAHLHDYEQQFMD